MSAVELLEYVPVAVKLEVIPLAMVAVPGVMAMLLRVIGGDPVLLLPPPQADKNIDANIMAQ